MSIAEKLTVIAENEQKVYDSGIAWLEDTLIHNRTGYEFTYLFTKMSLDGYTFKRTFKPIGTLSMTFYNYAGSRLPQNMDFSEVTSVYYSSGGNRRLFAWSINLLEVPDLGIPAITMGESYAYLRKCHTIECIRINETIVPPTFTECLALKNITFEGDIGRNISFSVSPLSVASLKSIITHLKDYSGTDSEYSYTLTFLTSAFQALEAEGATAEYNGTACTWAELIDNKKWNLTLA